VIGFWVFGVGNMYADGLTINTKGEINNLTEEELYDFF
jgi:hypothetical protein